MKHRSRHTLVKSLLFSLVAAALCQASAGTLERRISVEDYRDKMAGAWLGQSIGVAYGWPTEFRYKGKTIPDEKMPKWKEGLINETFAQDDLYVEMTFIDLLERYGIGVTSRRIGIEFANSRYRLWCANDNARNNLRRGIAAPWSAHPAFHRTVYDLDYQIESDFSGIISPGMPARAVEFGNTFGSVMNYGDGLYAGQFIGVMYAEAFFTDDRVAIVKAALSAIPAESEYAKMVRRVLALYEKNPRDWRPAWRELTLACGLDANGEKAPVTKDFPSRYASFPSIDVRLNGAYVLIGYLWGEGDMDKTMEISTCCGADSDCNPSSACGVLATSIGAKALDPKYIAGFDRTKKWEYTDYDWNSLLAASERLARKVVAAEGGRVEKGDDGREYFVIRSRKVECSKFVSAEKPGPLPDDVRYTDAEMAEILYLPNTVQGAPSRRRASK